MKLEYKDGKLCFDFYAAVSELPEAEKLQLADTLACDGEVVKFVTQQILDGWTEHGSYSSKFAVAIAEPAGGLDWACRQVALRSGEVAKKEIERLQNALASLEKRYQDLCNERRNRDFERF